METGERKIPFTRQMAAHAGQDDECVGMLQLSDVPSDVAWHIGSYLPFEDLYSVLVAGWTKPLLEQFRERRKALTCLRYILEPEGGFSSLCFQDRDYDLSPQCMLPAKDRAVVWYCQRTRLVLWSKGHIQESVHASLDVLKGCCEMTRAVELWYPAVHCLTCDNIAWHVNLPFLEQHIVGAYLDASFPYPTAMESKVRYPRLTRLSLGRCSALSSISTDLCWRYPKLETLEIEGASNLTTIPLPVLTHIWNNNTYPLDEPCIIFHALTREGIAGLRVMAEFLMTTFLRDHVEVEINRRRAFVSVG